MANLIKQAIACDGGDRAVTTGKLLTKDEARRIALKIAKLPDLQEVR